MKDGRLYDNEVPDLVSLPSNCLGYLDWTTGVIRLNLTHKEYVKINGTGAWDDYQETLLHETYHGLQIVSSGFLYRFAVEVSNNFWIDTLKIGTGIDNIQALVDNERLNTESIDSVFNHILSNDLGFSILDMMEGATYISHKLMFFPEYDINEFEYEMKKYGSSGSVYNKLYLYLKKILGVDVFYIIPTLVYYSLLFGKPKQALVALATEVNKSSNFIEGIESLIEYCDTFVENNRDVFGFVGSVVEVENLELHPFYGQQILKLRNLKERIVTNIANPFKIGLSFFEVCSRPILFNCGEMMYPKDYSSVNLDGLSKDDEIDTLKSMSVLSMKLFLNRSGNVFYCKI